MLYSFIYLFYLFLFFSLFCFFFFFATGLCGNFDGDKDNDLTLRDGTVVEKNGHFANQFSLEWRYACFAPVSMVENTEFALDAVTNHSVCLQALLHVGCLLVVHH
jgi:hypothetical protein